MSAHTFWTGQYPCFCIARHRCTACVAKLSLHDCILQHLFHVLPLLLQDNFESVHERV